MRQFLLVTSILDRFNASLCDAVTQSGRSAQILREIETSNLFLVPLDDRREWYRYHHLFGELLRHELRVDQPDLEADVHRRAAAWMLDEGFNRKRSHTCFERRTIRLRSSLIAESWYPIAASGGQSTVRSWLDSLPRDVSAELTPASASRGRSSQSVTASSTRSRPRWIRSQGPTSPRSILRWPHFGATGGSNLHNRVPMASRRPRRLPSTPRSRLSLPAKLHRPGTRWQGCGWVLRAIGWAMSRRASRIWSWDERGRARAP